MSDAVTESVQTIRYRAVMRLSYSVALLHLLEYARESREEFEYGPMSLAALDNQGLTICGPKLDGVQKVLADIPGLYLSAELEVRGVLLGSMFVWHLLRHLVGVLRSMW
jgi:hypothetical protein